MSVKWEIRVLILYSKVAEVGKPSFPHIQSSLTSPDGLWPTPGPKGHQLVSSSKGGLKRCYSEPGAIGSAPYHFPNFLLPFSGPLTCQQGRLCSVSWPWALLAWYFSEGEEGLSSPQLPAYCLLLAGVQQPAFLKKRYIHPQLEHMPSSFKRILR